MFSQVYTFYTINMYLLLGNMAIVLYLNGSWLVFRGFKSAPHSPFPGKRRVVKAEKVHCACKAAATGDEDCPVSYMFFACMLRLLQWPNFGFDTKTEV